MSGPSRVRALSPNPGPPTTWALGPRKALGPSPPSPPSLSSSTLVSDGQPLSFDPNLHAPQSFVTLPTSATRVRHAYVHTCAYMQVPQGSAALDCSRDARPDLLPQAQPQQEHPRQEPWEAVRCYAKPTPRPLATTSSCIDLLPQPLASHNFLHRPLASTSCLLPPCALSPPPPSPRL